MNISKITKDVIDELDKSFKETNLRLGFLSLYDSVADILCISMLIPTRGTITARKFNIAFRDISSIADSEEEIAKAITNKCINECHSYLVGNGYI